MNERARRVRDLQVDMGKTFLSSEELFREALSQARHSTSETQAWFCREWVKWGLPTFRLTHGLCAELLLTEPGSLASEPLSWPFCAFKVELPWPESPIAVPHEGVSGAFVAAQIDVLSFQTPGGEAMVGALASPLCVSEGGTSVVFCFSRAETIGAVLRGEQPDEVADAVFRLLVNLTLYLATLPGDARTPAGLARLETRGATPETRRYILGREIKLDKRIRDAACTVNAAGAARLPWRASYRYVVRGHWRNQRTGAGRTQTTRLWIRPHWKGPATAAEALERRYLAGKVAA